MQYIIYFLIAIFATTLGALTGMGGGVIIKPLMDILHQFDVQTIGVLSSITVFSMSLVAIGKHMLNQTAIPFQTAIPLAVGSVIGGVCGEQLLRMLIQIGVSNPHVTLTQNTLLALMILLVYIYMRNKAHIPRKHFHGLLPSLLAGLLLGICSSFLGIGGGPTNVVILIYLFSYDTKTATICSLVTILFAQLSKLLSIALTTGFSVFNLSVAPPMVVGAIIGGFLGGSFNKKCSEAVVEKAFNAVQLLVLGIAVFNVIRNYL